MLNTQTKHHRKILLLLTGIMLLAGQVQSQTINGCRIDNRVYTGFIKKSNKPGYVGAALYRNSPSVFSACGFTPKGSGPACYVYKGSGDPNQEVNYKGPYQRGSFTIVNCPLDGYEGLLLSFSLLVAFRHRIRKFRLKSIKNPARKRIKE